MDEKLPALVSIYIHIPFCKHRCAYCDFNTYAGLENLIPSYVNALIREIEFIGEWNQDNLQCHTVFLGGGTPSLLKKGQLAAIVNAVRRYFSLYPETEISMEANPGTLSFEYLDEIRKTGVNRLSLGMQSAIPKDLRLLERRHDFFDVANSVTWARKAGFDNINLDLMFGLPFQDFSSWEQTLNLAVSMKPEHLSVYSLILEYGTPMQHWVERGFLPTPDDDLAADMYEFAMEYLKRKNYVQYEISNWAVKKNKNVLMCKHNLQYWLNRPYLGFGAGAHGFITGYRISNIRAPSSYINRMKSGKSNVFPGSAAAVNISAIDKKIEMQETMMMGLRLTQMGVSVADFFNRFGVQLERVFQKEIDDLMEKNLIKWTGSKQTNLILTKKGRMLGNQVFMQFV